MREGGSRFRAPRVASHTLSSHGRQILSGLAISWLSLLFGGEGAIFLAAVIATPFEESPEALAWLRQFSAVDREVARQYLRTLRLVSESEFDREIQLQLDALLSSNPSENFALFSITEPPNQFAINGSRRTAGSSADRVRHLIENTLRVHGRRVSANPTVESMRAQRIRNIVLVEDFIGSGRRIIDFWRDLMPPSVKSWISRKWTKPWLVSYAAFDEGLRASMRHIRGLKRDQIRCVLDPLSARYGWTQPMRDVFSHYGAAARSNSGGLGFGKGGCTIIFQHACPNNVPLVLWADAGRFRPLFPNRGIPATLQQYFGSTQPLERAELLWGERQYLIALKLLDDVKRGAPRLVQWELVIALGLSARHSTWDSAWLSQRMRISESTIAKLQRIAYKLRLIDTSNHTLTSFGKELLAGLRRSGNVKPSGCTRPQALYKLDDVYYPSSCGGRAKH